MGVTGIDLPFKGEVVENCRVIIGLQGQTSVPLIFTARGEYTETIRKNWKKVSLTNQDAILIESNDSMAVAMTEKGFRNCIIKMIHEAQDEIREQM